MKWTEKASLRKCHLSKDLKEVRVGHVDIGGNRSPGRGNSQRKGSEVGSHMVYLGKSKEATMCGIE